MKPSAKRIAYRHLLDNAKTAGMNIEIQHGRRDYKNVVDGVEFFNGEIGLSYADLAGGNVTEASFRNRRDGEDFFKHYGRQFRLIRKASTKTAGGKARAEILPKHKGIMLYLSAEVVKGDGRLGVRNFVNDHTLKKDFQALGKVVDKAMKALRGIKKLELRDLTTSNDGTQNMTVQPHSPNEMFMWVSWDHATATPGGRSESGGGRPEVLDINEVVPHIIKALESVGLSVQVK